MLAFANAKINLGLFLTEKRTDGYHNLQTVFYPIKLHDVVELLDANETQCTIRGIDIPGSATDNICMKAFEMMQSAYDLPNQHIVLLKNIPIGAGLGGGSSDAAFLLKLINEKFNLKLTTEQLQGYARTLGADCSFFIENKSVYAIGKGDEFETLEIDLSNYFLVLVKPPVHVSTAAAYEKVTVQMPEVSLKEIITLPIAKWKDVVKNDFEPSVCSKFPEIDEIKTKLYAAGAKFALMSGSGSSVYAIFDAPVQLPQLETHNQVFYNV